MLSHEPEPIFVYGSESASLRALEVLKERIEAGDKKCGTPEGLRTFNGRNGAIDLSQELADAFVYVVSLAMEAEAHIPSTVVHKANAYDQIVRALLLHPQDSNHGVTEQLEFILSKIAP